MGSPRTRPLQPLYPKLDARAREAMGSKGVAAHQRGRLMAAMVEAVERSGYGSVSVSEVVALAGVSKNVFYENFADKQNCFLETFEEIVRLGSERIGVAYRAVEGTEARLRAAFSAFLELATSYGPAGRFVFLASLELGTAAVAARERAGQHFEAVLVDSFAEADGTTAVSPLVIRAIVGGTREVIYRRMAAGEGGRLESEMATLVDWALGYRNSGSRSPIGAQLLGDLESEESPAAPTLPSWEEPPSLPRARRELDQRERIIRATAQLAADRGYAALTVGAISARAGTSNQTFYANFDSKQDAFLAAFDALGVRAYAHTSAAFVARQGWLGAGAAGILAMLSHFATDPLHRRLVFFELAAAGPPALARAEAMLDVFIAFLEPAELPAEAPVRPPREVLEALAGGLWAVVEHEVAVGRGDALPALAPELIDFVLVAFEAPGAEIGD